MDELIGAIIEIVWAAVSRSVKRAPSAVPLVEGQRQRAPAAPRKTRTQPRGAPKPPPLPARVVAASAPPTARPVAASQSRAFTNSRSPLQVPLILGEVLGRPLALREPEF